jgi:alkaline phosphatase
VPSQPGQRLRSLFEWSSSAARHRRRRDRAPSHATPAAAYAPSPHRERWPIPHSRGGRGRARHRDAVRGVESGDGIDVALGGGRAQFLPASARDPEYPDQHGKRADGRDLAAAWQSARPGRAYVWNREQLLSLDLAKTGQILGLFEPSHMQFESDRARDAAGEPSLAEMTRVAIDRLARSRKGFALLVEGGRIDHGHHAGSAYLALHETIAFSAAVDAALAREPARDASSWSPPTTATSSRCGYPARGNPILGPCAATTSAAIRLGSRCSTRPGLRSPRSVMRTDPATGGTAEGRPDLSQVDTADPHYLQGAPCRSVQRPTAARTPLYAGGPGAPLFHGVQEQSYIYHAIVAPW